MAKDSDVILGHDSKVTMRFVIFIVLQVVMLVGGWYTLKSDVNGLQEKVSEMRGQIKELQITNQTDRVQSYSCQQNLAVLAEQTKQLKETVTILIDELGYHRSHTERADKNNRGIYLK